MKFLCLKGLQSLESLKYTQLAIETNFHKYTVRPLTNKMVTLEAS